DYCERTFVIDEKTPHVCAKMPIEKVDPAAMSSGGWMYSSGYDLLVTCFGQIVVEVSDNDSQGDTRYLLRGPDARWGVLVNGWGSCSGCDALQACGSYEALDGLRE